MLGVIDAGMRPLRIPPRFVPYMEKHRIYELFHELATELVIKKPADHIRYLKQCMQHAAKKRDSPRIIFLGPSEFEMSLLAQSLQKQIAVKPITLREIQQVSPEIPIESLTGEDICKNLKRMLKTSTNNLSSWILVDVPRNIDEARIFQQAGIIPTHALDIIPAAQSRSKKSEQQNLNDLRKVYANYLIRVEIGDRTFKDLAEACAILTKRKNHCGAPSLFRIALIGSRGSGSRSLAKHLSRRFNLVHVDYNAIMQQARLQQNPLGEALRMIEYCCRKRPKPETRIRVVEKYLLGENCQRRGWVLTGYPITVEDFKLLDMLATPPNRVIFVETDITLRKDRLLGRRYNIFTGCKHYVDSKNNSEFNDSERGLAIHPKDCKCVVERDIEEYEKNFESLLTYAGASATTIDGNADERIVRERLEACLIRPAPCAPPRVPQTPKKVDPMDVEFDPDDEPDPRIFDEIREPESLLSLI